MTRAIYLGETFCSYISINNSSSFEARDVVIKVFDPLNNLSLTNLEMHFELLNLLANWITWAKLLFVCLLSVQLVKLLGFWLVLGSEVLVLHRIPRLIG